MLILNNGVPKSGSTWMQQMLRVMLDPEVPGAEWRNHWMNPSVDPDRLEAFVASNDWTAADTLVKLHVRFLPGMEYLLRDDVRVIVTTRNLPDSVISWFHHQRRQGEVDLADKRQWLETRGLSFANHALASQKSWADKPNALLIPYEEAMVDPVTALTRVVTFLGKDIPESRLQEVAARTQVTRKPGEPLNENAHIRTAGLSVAEEELPADIYARLRDMDRQGQ